MWDLLRLSVRMLNVIPRHVQQMNIKELFLCSYYVKDKYNVEEMIQELIMTVHVFG